MPSATNMPKQSGGTTSTLMETKADYGNRYNSTEKKGSGYLGPIKRNDGSVMTELSVGVNIGGKEIEIPSIVPTLTSSEVEYLKTHDKPTKSIIDKAVEHAKKRIKDGKSPFYD